jgi:DNA polymerase-3 subunit epsilon
MRMYAFDCESTSVDVETARIVSAAVAIVGGGVETETLTLLADPGVEIPAEATAVHGITTERARAEGHPEKDVVFVVLNALAARAAGCAIVCQNARFDLSLLDRAARRHGLRPLSDREQPLLVVDVRVLDLWLDQYRAGKRTLADLCREYGTKLDAAHDAAADAIAAARVAWWIAHEVDVFRRGRGRDEIRELLVLRREWDRVRHDLPALHEAQRVWAFEQAAGLEEHFARKGAPERVPRDWPVVPTPQAQEAA